MAKSSAAPAPPNSADFPSRRKLACAILKADCSWRPADAFAEIAEELIAAHEKAYARAAHQALYEALSVARQFIFRTLDDAFTELYPKEERQSAIERHLTMKQVLAALALADAAKEGTNA